MKRILTLISALLCIHTANADTFTAKCKHVFDGDSFAVIKEGETEETEVRLYGIDAPEKGQEYAKQSREKLIKLIRNKQVRVEVQDTDTYGRCVGKVYVGKTYVNLEMVKAGFAWYYEHHAQKAKDLKKAESKARKEKKGLWKADSPINPREWRREHESAHEKKNSAQPLADNSTRSGICTAIKDGEEFTLTTAEGAGYRIYLNGTDAPEEEQDAAACQAAKDALKELIFNKEVRVIVQNSDTRRSYAAVYAGDRYINAEMVRRGCSWYSSLHAPDDAELKAADKAAKSAKQGIWAQAAPVAPWKWRKNNNKS